VINKDFFDLNRWLTFIRHEVDQFITIKSVNRPWQLPVASAMAMGGPVLVGAWTHHLNAGLTASLGALVFLYLPERPFLARLRSLAMSVIVMMACYWVGSLSAIERAYQAPGLAIVTTMATLYCRAAVVGGPPGSLFFVIAASIGASSQTIAVNPNRLGLVFWGCLWGFAVAVFYCLLKPAVTSNIPLSSAKKLIRGSFANSVLIGMVVGASLLLAQWLQLENPYWVPVSCLAVVQGANFREIWNKQLHRMIGTTLGLLMISAIFQTPLSSDWQIAGWIVLFSFAIEMTVTRHYATAVMFITPMTILLADAGQAHQSSLWSLAQSRLVDTAVGCCVGLLGGFFLHAMQRNHVEQPMKQTN
jgi:uncharacterized membrane protein YccC